MTACSTCGDDRLCDRTRSHTSAAGNLQDGRYIYTAQGPLGQQSDLRYGMRAITGVKGQEAQLSTI
jgi:hypothetical protein